VKLLESKNPAILVTWGVIRSEVILPAGAAEWADDRVCIVLRHELAHIRRSDWIVQIIGQAVRIIFWFNPVIWIVCRRLRLESECACDDAVLSQAIEGHEYAGHLLELARTLNRSGGAWSAALAMSRPSTIERRFSAMLDPSINRQPISRRALLTSLSLGLGLTLCLSIAKAGASVRPSTVTAAAPVVIEQGKVAAPVEPQPAAEPGTAAPVRVQREVQPTSVPASVAVAAPVIPVEPQQAPANVSTPGPVRRRNREADWALFEAAEHGRNSEIDALIREGANVNAALHGDGSPLIAAAREGRLNTVQMLLDRGADPNLAVPGDGSPLIAAAREGYLDVARLLLDRGANPNLSVAGDGNPLILAAAEGHADIVTLLLDRAANINEIVYGDENPLIRASAEGRLDVVRLLVNRKADVNARVWIEPEPWRPNGEWRTPLSEARKRGHQDVVQFLLSVGAKE
jgi:ankyrin repeat protein